MLHLFNSCYVYPDFLFRPDADYVIIGENHLSYGGNLDNSFYYTYQNKKVCLGKFSTYEEFIGSGLFQTVLNKDTKTVIFSDTKELIKLYTGFLQCHVKNLTEEFYLNAIKLFAIKVGVRSESYIYSKKSDELNQLQKDLIKVTKLDKVKDFPLDKEWVISNANIEWKLMNGNESVVKSSIDKFVYSFFDEARVKFLSRKSPEGTWVSDQKNYSFDTVVSMKELYLNIRKEIAIFVDTLILDYYENGNSSNLIKDPKFLLLISGNKHLPDVIDIWLLRWVMKMTPEQIKQLDIQA
jgi:hypothetical protein